ncbi:hypothetical protein B5G52_05370 [Pseudoalteromonas sp. A601]|nr:hypothetical protein B5G52_05370 [Pseudoalteromonas sp. A601]
MFTLFTFEITMPKPFSNMLAVLFILLTFAEQSMAYSVSPSNSTHLYSQTLNIDSPLGIENTTKSDDDCCEIECCDSTCFCPANTCVSAFYLPSEITTTQIDMQNHHAIKQNIAKIISVATYIYRPPIAIS